MISRVEKRDIIVILLLSFITCGIYGIIWYYNMTEDCAKASGDNTTSGGQAILFTILTCGIYYIYWQYKMGKLLYTAAQKRNLNATDNSLLYLVFALFQMSIVSNVLIQLELNKLSDFDYER